MTGIYKIENKVNGKVYIGSSIDIQRRWWKHQSELRLQRHPSKKLQSAYNHFGKDIFSFSVIEECKKEQLLDREIYWIKEYNSIRDGYNYLLGRKWDTAYLKEIDPKNGVVKGKYRARTDEEIFYIRAIQYVFGPCQTVLAAIFNTTRSSINYYYHGTRYQEICKQFVKLNPLELSGWFDGALDRTDFSLNLIQQFNINTNAILLYYSQKFNLTAKEMCELFRRTESSIYRLLKNENPNIVNLLNSMKQEEKDLKLFLLIKTLLFNRQSISNAALKWAERFNDYLEREYTISDDSGKGEALGHDIV